MSAIAMFRHLRFCFWHFGRKYRARLEWAAQNAPHWVLRTFTDGRRAMIHSHAVPALLKHGYGIEQVKQWRTEQEKAGKPSTFDDFLRAHGLCVHCRSAGVCRGTGKSS